MSISSRLQSLLAEYISEKEKVEQYEKLIKECNNHLNSAEQNLFSAMIDEELTSFKTDDGVSVTRKIRTFYSVNKDNMDALINWLACVGGDGIIKTEPSVNTLTLSSFIKEKEDSIEIPDFIKSYDKRSISVKGRTNKDKKSIQ